VSSYKNNSERQALKVRAGRLAGATSKSPQDAGAPGSRPARAGLKHRINTE